VFAVLKGLTPELGHLEFGDILGRTPEIHAHLRWVIDDYETRRDELWRFAPGFAAPVLAEIAVEVKDDPRLLAAAILGIGWYGQPEEAATVHAFEGHPDKSVRKAVVRALGQLGNFKSVYTVARYLEEDDPVLRQENIISAGKFGLPNALVEMRRRAGSDPDLQRLVEEGARRIEAVQTLAKTEDLGPLVHALLPTAEYEDLCNIVPFVFAHVGVVLADRERDVNLRVRAARVLGLGRAVNCLAILCRMVIDETEPLRLRVGCAWAVGFLAGLGPVPGIVDFLLPQLDTTEHRLQDEVITAVGRSGAARALEPLLSHWDDREGKVHDRVRRAVRDLAVNDAAQHLLRHWPWWRPLVTGPQTGDVVLYLVRDDTWRRGYDAGWVYPELEKPGPEARRDGLLVIALFGTRADLPRLERVMREDPVEENRWLAAVAYRIILPIP
jgi:hypothetical protein